ncbi:unnamed protein product [Closterium sp. NIES-64]|nr:unnamed protein product [Closterium sp. NIES-64]
MGVVAPGSFLRASRGRPVQVLLFLRRLNTPLPPPHPRPPPAALHLAAFYEYPEVVEHCTSQPLHLAAFYEHPEVVQVLLAAGADTDARNSTGNTPLQGNLDVVRMPFETTKVKCQKLCPSLSQFACIKGNLDVARILLDAGADLYATSDDKGNALEYAQGVHARWL